MQTNLPYFRSSFAKIQRRRVESDSPFCIAWLAPAVKNAGENLPLISAQKQSSAGSGVVVMNITEFKATIDEMLLRKVCVGRDRVHTRSCSTKIS